MKVSANEENVPVKIVVAGPVYAGKTTLIQTVSDVHVLSTEEPASEDIGKETTTVALDFGFLTLGGFQVHLFGTPGQERFDFMWSILCEGATGLILMVNASRVRDFPAARRMLDFITSQIPIPFVIGVTHLDSPNHWDIEDITSYFQVPEHLVVGVDARDRIQVLNLFDVLCSICHACAVAA